MPTASGPRAVLRAVPHVLIAMPWIYDAVDAVRSFARPSFFSQTDLSRSHLSEKQDDPLFTYLGPHVRVSR